MTTTGEHPSQPLVKRTGGCSYGVTSGNQDMFKSVILIL